MVSVIRDDNGGSVDVLGLLSPLTFKLLLIANFLIL